MLQSYVRHAWAYVLSAVVCVTFSCIAQGRLCVYNECNGYHRGEQCKRAGLEWSNRWIPNMDKKALAVSIGAGAAALWLWRWYTSPRLPPGPRGWPLVGHIKDLSHLDMVEIGKKYGDIFTVWVGNTWVNYIQSLQGCQPVSAPPQNTKPNSACISFWSQPWPKFPVIPYQCRDVYRFKMKSEKNDE